MLIHLASEAVRTGTPVVDVEGSMTAFARSLGLETNGQQLKSLKDQLARLASATVRMGVVEEGRAVQVNTQFVSAFDLWFPKQPDQRVLWPSNVRLSEEYFQSLGQARRAAGPPRRGDPGVVVDGSRRVRLAGPAAASRADGQARNASPGPPYTSNSDRDSHGCGISAGGSSRRCTRCRPRIRPPGCQPTKWALRLEHSPPPVPPRYTGMLTGTSPSGAEPGHGNLVAPPTIPQAAAAEEKRRGGRGGEPTR